jgi:hypothetical protein
MSLTQWKPLHETLFNFGADCAVLDSQVAQVFGEIEQIFAQLTAYAEELAERERQLGLKQGVAELR